MGDPLTWGIIAIVAYQLGWFKIGRTWSKIKQAKLERKLEKAKTSASK